MVVTAFFEEKDSQNLRMEGCLVKHEKKNKQKKNFMLEEENQSYMKENQRMAAFPEDFKVCSSLGKLNS